ncbi:MAG: HAMP domain-containing sensor histidine kinase [Actinomycetota bacterium]
MDEAPTVGGGSFSFEQSDLVLFWQRLRALMLGIVALGALLLAVVWGSDPLHPGGYWRLNAPLLIVGLAVALAVDAWSHLRRRSSRVLLSIYLDATAIAGGLVLLQVPLNIAPFLYVALTAAFLLPMRQAALVWCYDVLLIALVVASRPLDQWLGAAPTGTQLAVAEWLIAGIFGLLCVAETLILTGAVRRFAQARQSQLAYQVRRKDEFLAGVSHALRTPLTCVVGFGQLIEKDWADRLPDPVGVMLGELNQQADLMSGMVDNLVIRAQDTMGEMTLTFGPTDLRQVASDTIRSVAWLYPHKVIRLAGDPQVVAWADPTRTRQVARNLLSNAVAHGGDNIVLEVTSGTEAALTVTDDGSGPVAYSDSLPLRPFEKCNPTLASPTLGFGLPVSLRLAHLMGGNLTHRHTPGVSTFTLTLPSCPPAGESTSSDEAPPTRLCLPPEIPDLAPAPTFAPVG